MNSEDIKSNYEIVKIEGEGIFSKIILKNKLSSNPDEPIELVAHTPELRYEVNEIEARLGGPRDQIIAKLESAMDYPEGDIVMLGYKEKHSFTIDLVISRNDEENDKWITNLNDESVKDQIYTVGDIKIPRSIGNDIKINTILGYYELPDADNNVVKSLTFEMHVSSNEFDTMLSNIQMKFIDSIKYYFKSEMIKYENHPYAYHHGDKYILFGGFANDLIHGEGILRVITKRVIKS